MRWASSFKYNTSLLKNGFTIVELLIVVVVIAILAAISIVAYSGITKSANNSALQETLTQTARKIEIYKVNSTTGQLPLTLSDAGVTLTNGNGALYSYSVSSDATQYCLAASKTGRTYYISSSVTSPKTGICNGSSGTTGTGDVATDGLSSTASFFSIFNGASPGTTQTVYTDGGGSLKVGNRFYTSDAAGIKVRGVRIYNPPSSDTTFLSLGVTAYAYVNDWTNSTVLAGASLSSTPVATKAYSLTRTAGTWTDILFDSPFTLPKISSSAGAADLLTLAVQYAGGNHYVFVTPTPNGGNTQESSIKAGTYLAEHPGLGRGVNTINLGVSTDSYYGIDLIFDKN
jgi:prepilin-type N-terminal cleavage/methylation domain-containing protein